MTTGRFAPSTTGPAHPGTLLAALLAWLDQRARGGRIVLRLEDLDPERCRPEFTTAMVADLAWLGLDWDAVVQQSTSGDAHVAALDRLAALGRLYPCACSRSDLAAGGRRAPDGGWAYANVHRGTPLPPGGWRACTLPLRAWLDDGHIAVTDLGGVELSQDPAGAMGDPVVRRRDGAIAYQLAVVVDDAASGVTDVVRGRDIAASTATQVALQHLLGLPTPTYRHHLLLLEQRDRKLAKLHGAVGADVVRQHYDPRALCGFLAWCAGLQDRPEPCTPAELLTDFSWARVTRDDVVVEWDGQRLHRSLTPPSPAPSHPLPCDQRLLGPRATGPLDKSMSPRLSAPDLCTVLTPADPAAIGIVTTPALPALLDRALPTPGRARFARLCAADGQAVDEVMALHRADGRLELHTHGGPGVRAAVLAALASHGLSVGPPPQDRWARLAAAPSAGAAAWLLAHGEATPPFSADFLIRLPVILITGPANAGKSTLLNHWCGAARAVVSPVAGTTRDLVTAEADLGPWRVRLVDSAGLRPTTDALENAGQQLAHQARAQADLVIYLQPADDHGAQPGDLVVAALADRCLVWPTGLAWSDRANCPHDPDHLLEQLAREVRTHLGLGDGQGT